MPEPAAARHETVDPHNREAEEHLAGAVVDNILGPTALAAAREIVHPQHFYLSKPRLVFEAACRLADQDKPHDIISVAEDLERHGEILEAGGRQYLAELGALFPHATNAPHYARIVVEHARARRALRVSTELRKAALNGGLDDHPEIIRALQELIDEPAGTRTVEPLWWQDAMTEQIPDSSEYVEGVLQTGVLTDIVGLPYLHKTAIALELATKVARGTGNFLGRFPIKQQAPVAYFWGDDSRAAELERIQGYGHAHDLADIPVALYLNPGLTLPADLPLVKTHIRQHGYRLLVFDSLYNFAPGIDWAKDHTAVITLYAALKRLCDEIDSLTIVLVDHAAKPSDSNRGRQGAHQSFGSIYKAASVRSTISVEKDKSKLYISATGNNIRGFKRTAAFWADDQLELRLADEPDRQEIDEAVTEMLRTEILDYLKAHPGASTNKVREGVRRNRQLVVDILEGLRRDLIVVDENELQTLDSTAPEALRAQSGVVQNRQHDDRARKKAGRGRAQSWRIIEKPHE